MEVTKREDKRAGTENVAGIVGLGKAIELAYQELDEHNKKDKRIKRLIILIQVQGKNSIYKNKWG